LRDKAVIASAIVRKEGRLYRGQTYDTVRQSIYLEVLLERLGNDVRRRYSAEWDAVIVVQATTIEEQPDGEMKFWWVAMPASVARAQLLESPLGMEELWRGEPSELAQ